MAVALVLLLAMATNAAEPWAAVSHRRQSRFNILTFIPMSGSSHTFELIAVAGQLARRCAGSTPPRPLAWPSSSSCSRVSFQAW